MPSASLLSEAQTQVQRAIQRNLKGLAYFG